MQILDLDSWPRKQHFQVYNAFDYPHINLCAPVDITNLRAFVKEEGLSFAITTLYLLARVANTIPEFRYRIRGDQVVVHETVNASMTVLLEDETFSFCTIKYSDNFAQFYMRAQEKIAHVKKHPILEDGPDEDDLLYMTSIPWVSFTGMMHPIHMHPVDSVPRIAWGKFYSEGNLIKMPVSVQVNHAVMDGLHVGRYYALLEELLTDPNKTFNEVS